MCFKCLDVCVCVPESQNDLESMHEHIRVHAYFNVHACLYVKVNVCLCVQYVCIYASLHQDIVMFDANSMRKIYMLPWTIKPGSFF